MSVVRGPRGQIVLLAAITALGSLAIHMFVPAMPRAALALHTSRSAVQVALTVYLVSVALGQIATGPLSDRLGRRPVLLGGAALFVVGSVQCWAAQSIELLLAGRVLQALGASAGLVSGRAMVTDVRSESGARDMAFLTAIVMLSPMLAPLLGNAIADWAGWRAIFAVLGVAGALCGVAVFVFLNETLAPTRRAESTLLADWKTVLLEPIFLRNLAIATLLGGSLYIFLAASPFLMVETYGVGSHDLGVPYGLVAAGAGAGALSASLLATRRSARGIMALGVSLGAAGGLVLLLGALAGLHHPAALIGPMIIVTFGGGLVTPNAIVAALVPLRGRAGTAVSLYGALQMGGSAVATFAVALLPSHDPRVAAGAIAALTGLAAALQLGATNRR